MSSRLAAGPAPPIGYAAVSAVGLVATGVPCRKATTADAIAVVDAALDAGITLIDTADMYGPTAVDPHHNETLSRSPCAVPGPLPAMYWSRRRVATPEWERMAGRWASRESDRGL